MGANASTAVPVYVSGQVLDAARLNLTNCGVPVFSGTATRDSSFGGSGEKVLAEGQLCYLEDSNVVQYYDSAAWQPVGTTPALTLVSATTVGTAVSTVTVSNAFSATYDAYLITISGGTSSSATMGFNMTLGATATGYYYAFNEITYAGVTGSNNAAANATSMNIGYGGSNGAGVICQIINPFLAKNTVFLPNALTLPATTGYTSSGGGYLNNTTSYTAFTIVPSVGTITGHIIRVYGYQNS